MLQYIVTFISLVWLLAVYKVFILDDHVLPKISSHVQLSRPKKSTLDHKPLPHDSSRTSYRSKRVEFTSDLNSKHLLAGVTHDSSSKIGLPLSSEWSSIHSYERTAFSNIKNIKVHKGVSKREDGVKLFTANSINHATESTEKDIAWDNTSHLQWPPVNEDGSIPTADGFDIMPIIDLKVPKFWYPPNDADWNNVGTKINNLETIFLMIASYRDFQCRETISLAFQRADHPERLYVGAVDQTVPGDIGCLDLEIPCSVDNSQPICKYRNQISIFHIDASKATGPVTARHVGDRLYRGQYFVMQMDAHCSFVRHWDTLIINQWKSTKNEMAVLTSYLSDVQGSLTLEGDSTRNTRPIMCNSAFEGVMPARYLRHGSQPEDYAVIRDMPQLEPYWAAGFSFSRGHFKLRVPYDAYLPMVFQGEEIAISIRAFTYGYDFYAPKDSVVFHEYADMSSRRKKIHMFWENSGHAGEGIKSLKRATAIIGMAPDIDERSWDHREIERYGLGKIRPLNLFYKLFLIDAKERTSVQLCPFVKSGIMHRDFQKYLNSNGLGIDYNMLMNYNTLSVLSSHLRKQHPYWEKKIGEYMESKNKSLLADALSNAEAVGLTAGNPDLMRKARNILQSLL